MKNLAALLALAAAPLVAQANCFGTGSFQTCTDSSGNTYNIQRYGNTTSVYGSNPSTGSQWSQQSHQFGNTTIHNGTAANGRQWNGTTHNLRNFQFHNGTDSRGQPFNKVCGPLGCF